MGGEWRERPLEEICAFLNRGAAPSYVDREGLIVLNQKCVRDGRVLLDQARRTDSTVKRISKERILKPFDVLVNSTGVGTLGRVAQVLTLPEAATVDSHITIVRADPQKVFPRYLGFALRKYQPEIEALAEGSTGQTELSRARLAQFRVALPPLAEQRAIAHILGTLDDKIELNRRMSQTLEEMARAIFKSWFVDFDPVRAKAAVRREHPDWTNAQVSRAAIVGARGNVPLRPEIAELFPDRLVDSELGEIPEGWEVGTLAEIVGLLRDHVNPLSEPASEFLHFSIPAFDEGQWPKLERGDKIKSQKWQVPPGVVLLSKLNPEIERVWFVDVKPDDRSVCSTEFLVLRPKPPYGRSYVYCLMRSPWFRQQIEGLVTGTSKSHQRAQPGAILQLAAIKPPALLITGFDWTAASLLNRTLECRHESRTLAALRDALLPKLISGQIRVKDAERFLEKRGL
jgi:type I restriction enzyme S subunit